MNVIIVGGGKIGAYLAALLLAGGHQVTVIELSRAEKPRLMRDLPQAKIFIGSGAEPDVLETAGIHQADVVAAVTGEDERNLVITSLARFEFNVPRTIARVNNPKNAWMFTTDMGVDVAVNQADLMGHLIAEEMSLGDMMILVKLRRGLYSIVEEKVDSESIAAGKALCDLQLPEKCVLAAIIRKGDLIIASLDTTLEPADEVLAIVHSSKAQQLADLLGPKK